MLGAIVGDIVGSRFEFTKHKGKEFELFTPECNATDDSVMTLAIAKAILSSKPDYSNLAENTVKYMRKFGTEYPDAGYGGKFRWWLKSENPEPYNSWGNGAAMRVSPCGWVGNTISDVKYLSRLVTSVTHNHPEGLKGAEAVSVAIFLARTHQKMSYIQDVINDSYYRIDFTLDDIRPSYTFDVSCQGSVPQAFEAFFESTDFEDAIRNAISIGGDTDTIGAITGSIAEAYYGIPSHIEEKALSYLDKKQLSVVNSFNKKYKNT